MRYLVLTACLILTACSGVEVLEPAHKMAVENQQNLDANVEVLIQNFLKTARSHPDYDAAVDEPVLQKFESVIREQMAISTAYMALIDAYIKGKDLDADAFRRFLGDLPEMIEQGVDIWEQFEELFGDED